MARKLIVSDYVTLDGVVQDPVGMENSGLGNWIGPYSRGPAGDAIMHAQLWAADIVLLGRTTYDGFAPVWPTVKDEAGFAKKLNTMRKYVASSTLTRADWTNTTVLSGDVIGAVRTLKAEDGGDILVYGSAKLVHALLREDLVDGIELMIYPTALGRGTKLFPEGYAGRFETTRVDMLGTGIVHTAYRRVA